MKFINNDYLMSITPSKLQYIVWISINAVLHFVLAMILLRLSWPGIVVSSISMFSYAGTIAVVFFIKVFPVQLTINEQGNVNYNANVIFNGQLLASSFSTHWFIYFKCEVSASDRYDNKEFCMLIWRDSLEDESFRRLARLIRLKRQMI